MVIIPVIFECALSVLSSGSKFGGSASFVGVLKASMQSFRCETCPIWGFWICGVTWVSAVDVSGKSRGITLSAL